MILNYIWCKDGKMHYNTLAGFNANGKWTFTDVLHDNYVLEGEYEFIYNLEENYFAIVDFAEMSDIKSCKYNLRFEMLMLCSKLHKIVANVDDVASLLEEIK